MTGFGYNINGFGVGSSASVFERGLFAGGTGRINVIQYIDIATLGNATDFGDLSASKDGVSSISNLTRGIFSGGNTGSAINVIEYITIATTGDVTDFGDLYAGANRNASQGSINSATRGIVGGGYMTGGTTNIIQYVTIGSTGNSSAFGDLSAIQYRGYQMGSLSSSTRGVFGGGGDISVDNTVIDYVTIASTGNATDFGNMSSGRDGSGGCGNSVRGLFLQGYNGDETFSNVIDYITIASTGNATDFGDVSTASRHSSSCSGPARAVVAAGAGGYPYRSNIMEYVTIASTGNSSDFGDLLESQGGRTALSSANGGSV